MNVCWIMIETMNNYHQAYDAAEDHCEDGNSNDYTENTQQHPYSTYDSALEEISDAFVHELFRREAAFSNNNHSSSVPSNVPEFDNHSVHIHTSSSKRKRQQDTNVNANIQFSSSSLPTQTHFSSQVENSSGFHTQTQTEATMKTEDIADTTPFFTFKDMKDGIRSRTREQLEYEVNRFNVELEKRKAELGLGESSHLDLSSMKKRREKWSANEMGTLWGAISLHGNNWTAISKIVPGRNYFQVKDKGRRELCGRGWETGRKKSEGSEAMLHAQAIAQIELQKFFKGKAAAMEGQGSKDSDDQASPVDSGFRQTK